MFWKSFIASLFVATILLSGIFVHPVSADPMEGLDVRHPMKVDKSTGEIRILAELQPKAFSGGWFKRTPGHHAVTWKGGKQGGHALLAAYVDDSSFYDAMVSIGAIPGNNLTRETWEERTNKADKAADKRVEGSPVEAFVWWPGLKTPLPLAALFNAPSGKGIDLRFGGHKSLIPVWRSGCIICLQSCPGGKISNHSYTMRDYAEKRATFTINAKNLPKSPRKAVVIIRLLKK
jgi:hypothetical protein